MVFDPLSSTGAFALASVSNAAFVAKLNSTATALVYSTYLGGSSNTQGTGIATNGLGEAFVTGNGSTADLPVASALPTPPSLYAGFVVGITDATAPCSYSINPNTQAISGSLQNVTYGVNAPSGCSWTAGSDQSWATVVGGASGTGAGLVTVQATANNTASTRSATLTINTGSAMLAQAPSSCTYSLSSNSASLSASGGPEQVNVTTSPGCPWTVVNNNPWAINVTSGASGSGNGTVNFTVLPSADLNSRSVLLSIMGNPFTITEGGACTFSLTSASLSSAALGGTITLGLTASALGCTWTASSNATWLTMNYGSGSGSSTVGFEIALNAGPARSGTLTIAGQTFTVNQGPGTPNNRSFVSITGSDLNDCTVSAYCRTLAEALVVTNPGGEVVVVDSGGYGPVTITRPVVITAIGIDASISETTPGLNAITINTTGNVTINGLNLSGGGTGNDGVSVQAVGFLRLYNMQIRNFGGDGIDFTASGSLAVYDSKINDCLDGLFVYNPSAKVYVHNTDFDHNAFGAEAFEGNLTIADSSAHYNQAGFFVDGGTVALDNDRVMFNGTGLELYSGSLSFANCLISDNTTAWDVAEGLTMTDTNPGTSLITPGQLTSGILGAATVLQ